MARQPDVVIVARHGARLDAADANWHLSTPTPYDPPLTYGGWTQCRALGVRIASLLQAREHSLNDATNDSSAPDGLGSRQNGDGSKKRKRRKHKVVIHTSPFLRCLQTSVAISAGMSQYHPTIASTPATSKSRTPSSMHSASPRLRAMDGVASSPSLAPIAEPKQDFAHEIARRTLSEHKLPNPKSKLRVDAFLGEWLNPQYYEQITPPPPSALMVATAKGELMQNEHIDVYTPTVSTKSSSSNLWGGSNGTKSADAQGAADDWSHVREALPAPTARRDRATSVTSGGSSDTGSGRRSPFRPGHVLHSQSSTMPKYETTAYVPPTPSYAVSSSDHIPRGYVAHARNATVNVDYQWDSSRYPQDWGDGGEYGEEWSSMHKRFRRGLNHMVHWYSQNDPDYRNEDALGIDQVDHDHEHEDEEQEDLVVVMVTHGAGCNALIGAITEQPVLLDVGMASLTMAVKKDNAPVTLPPLDYCDSPKETTPGQSPRIGSPANGDPRGGLQRRTSSGTGLSAIYEMKIVASTEHLRPGSDPAKAAPSPFSTRSGLSNDPSSRAPRRGDPSSGGQVMAPWNLHEPSERPKSQSTALGSIRRPGAANSAAPRPPVPAGGIHRSASMDPESVLPLSGTSTPNSAGGGLWTPPSGRTPLLEAKREKEEKQTLFSTLNDSRPGSSGGPRADPKSKPQLPVLALDGTVNHPDIHSKTHMLPLSGRRESQAIDTDEPDPAAAAANGAPLAPIPSAESERDVVPELPSKDDSPPMASDNIPDSLSRKLSQKGLWGSKPSGDEVKRSWAGKVKRRWTVSDQDGNG
ncbi:hypothetical protein Q7P37_005502 [Cladosporium fusiforme]